MENGTSSVKQEKALAKGFLLITKFVRGMDPPTVRIAYIIRSYLEIPLCKGLLFSKI